MVESLKRSVAELEPPLCPHCHVKMIWYRAIRAAEHATIVHYFQCANCNRIEEKAVKVKGNGDGQGPLSGAPRERERARLPA